MTGEASRHGANGNCNGWSERVTRLVVDEISPEELRELERHLRSCEECRDRLSRRQEVVALLRRTAGSDAQLSAGRRRAVDAAASGAARSGPRRWLGAASAAALLLLGAMIWVLTPGASDERQLARSSEAPRAEIPAAEEERVVVRGAPASLAAEANEKKKRLEKFRELTRNPAPAAVGAIVCDAESSPAAPLRGGYALMHEKIGPVDSIDLPRASDLQREPSRSRQGEGAATPGNPPIHPNRTPSDLPIGQKNLEEDESMGGAKQQNEPHLRAIRRLKSLQSSVKEVDAAGAGVPVTEPFAQHVPGGGKLYSPIDWNLPAEWSAEDRVRHLLAQFACRPQETPSAMFFRYWGDNPFVDTIADNVATFAADVDTASYTLTRNYLSRGMLPPKEAIRTEEFVNYFPSGLAPPAEGDFALTAELARSPFAEHPEAFLMKVGVKAREVDRARRKPLALTLVIDVSGSMATGKRLELVKDSIRTLAGELAPADTVGIVVFESTARDVLQPVSAARTDAIFEALTSLSPGSSTNVQQGLDLGYAMALRHRNRDGMNRVALFSDGVANTGVTAAEAILGRVREAREEGILLNTFGVGMGNHNDARLEQLADKGDGQCAYIDSLAEATRIFRRDFLSTFETIARDAKIQVEFDREVVASFRQIGYENRAVADRDFRNDAIDAGEINAGHEVVALFELLVRPGVTAAALRELPPANLRIRYRPEGAVEAVEASAPARGPVAAEFAQASPRFRLSATVAAFADLLRGSFWARQMAREELLGEARALLELDTANDARVAELVALIEQADRLVADRYLALYPPHARELDDLRYNYYLRTRLSTAEAADAEDRARRLAEENRRLENALRALLNASPGVGR